MELSEEDILDFNLNIKMLLVILYNLKAFKDQLIDEINNLKKEKGRYDAIGILDGNPTYFKKVAEIEARIMRTEALVKIIDTWEDTKKAIDEGEEVGDSLCQI